MSWKRFAPHLKTAGIIVTADEIACSSDCAILNRTETFCQVSMRHGKRALDDKFIIALLAVCFCSEVLERAMQGEKQRMSHSSLLRGN